MSESFYSILAQIFSTPASDRAQFLESYKKSPSKFGILPKFIREIIYVKEIFENQRTAKQ